jgi:hypothetical protein
MDGVRKTYQVGGDEVAALDHVDLTVEPDEITSVHLHHAPATPDRPGTFVRSDPEARNRFA